jgi:hypothetical protein
MDNKITKKRLGNLFAYDWIMMLIAMVVIVIGWEFLYALTSVRITAGQGFYYYYDYEINGGNDTAFKGYLNDTFSYDILEWGGESMPTEAVNQDVIELRYASNEVDVVFTSTLEVKNEETGYMASRAKKIIDLYDAYDFRELYKDCEKYLKQFLTNENASVLDFNNYSESKIKAYFHNRQASDNRYKWKQITEQDEINRIKKLSSELADFKTILDFESNLPKEESIFYYYHKYEFSLTKETTSSQKASYQEKYDLEGGEKAFGLKLEKLPKSDKLNAPDVNAFFRMTNASDSKNVILTVFNVTHVQPDLQFETISFVNTVVRTFSSILN